MGYGDDAGFQAYLDANGLTLPADAPSIAALRNRGADYLDSAYASRLLCSSPTGGISQAIAWPRTGHFFRGAAIPDNVVPIAWVNASYRAAWLIANNADAFTSTINPGARTKMEKVDVLQVEYFDNGKVEAGSGGAAVIDAEIDGMVSALLCPSRSFGFMVI